MPDGAWQFINQAGPLALLAWALINERRLTRVESSTATLERIVHGK